MARVTVEDCILRVPNRFDLVLLAAQRAREVSSGSPLTVDRDNDKNPVVALREIADETVSVVDLDAALIQSLQKHVENDEPEDDGFGVLGGDLASEIGDMMVGEELLADGLNISEGPDEIDDAAAADMAADLADDED